MKTTIGGKRKCKGLLTWLVAASILMIGILPNLSIPITAAPTPDLPPIPGATRILTIGPDNSTGVAGVMGGVGQPWLSDHEVLHFRQGSLYRYDVTSNIDIPLSKLTHQVKTSPCYLYFLNASSNGQQVIWGMSGNNPLFVATMDGTRREQWDGDGGMTQPFWCADGKHWMQFHFGGSPQSLRWTKIQMHSLDTPQTSQTFSSAPPGLNGLDILAAPSADWIIARKRDPFTFITPSAHKGVRHPDGSESFVIEEKITSRITPNISVWSLHEAKPLHQWKIPLPGWVQEVAVSPDGRRVAWLMTSGPRRGGATSVSMWASGLDGGGLHRIGVVRPRVQHRRGPVADFASQLHWVLGDKKISFLYGDALWTAVAN